MDAFPEVLRSELDWLAAELGAARDAEVLAGSTLVGAAEACTTEMEWQPLTQVAATIAKATRRRVAASGRSVRYSRLMLGLVAWLQSSRWRESRGNTASQVLAAPLDKVATKILRPAPQEAARERQAAQGRHSRGAPPRPHCELASLWSKLSATKLPG